MQPDDKLTKDTPIAPPDQFESPREESILTTNPLAGLEEDDQLFNEFEREHDLDLGRTHGGPGAPTVPAVVHGLESGSLVPRKILLAGVALTLWAGIYLGFYSGGFQGDVFNEEANYRPVAAVKVDPNSPEAMIALGQKLYTVNCVQCHQSSGLGQPGQFPPLAGSEWVVGNAPKRLTQILLHGIQGSIHVKGGAYNNAMPPWNMLKDRQIAAILTYVRQAWGNAAGPISEADMAAARKETASRTAPWTEAELLQIPEGPLSGEAAPPVPATGQPPAANANNPPTAAPGNLHVPAPPMGQGPVPVPSPKP
jgi:mono/diheme cytochrome c family protein